MSGTESAADPRWRRSLGRVGLWLAIGGVALYLVTMIPLPYSAPAVAFRQWIGSIAVLVVAAGIVVVLLHLTLPSKERSRRRAAEAARRSARVVAPAGARTNPLAILALVFGLIGSVIGAILGHIALAQLRRTGERGRGLAVAGIVLGYLSFATLIVVVVVAVAASGSLH